MSDNIKLLVDGLHGAHVMRLFLTGVDCANWNISPEDKDIILHSASGCDEQDAIDNVLDNAMHVDDMGNTWELLLSQDLYAICYKKVTDEEYAEFFGETA